MFGLGSIGNFLPMIGSAFGGGGLFSLGFSLLSGLLTNITSPKNPGFENFTSHPGFSNGNANPGFGSMGGGPNVSTFGSMTNYFGNAYTGDDYSILPQTPSGQYYGNAAYSYGNQGVNYSPNAPITYRPNNHYGHQMGQLKFGGQFSQYMNSYNSVVLPQAPFFPSYQPGNLSAHYGSAAAPSQQGYQPVMSHYGFGSPQQYNPASTLYGHQNGSVRVTYGGPQNNNNKVVVNHHHHHHLHLHNHPAQEQPPADKPADKPSYPPVAEQPSYEPKPKPEPKPDTKPPVSYYPEPQPTPDYPEPKPTEPVDNPAVVVSNSGTAAQSIQTSWGRVPHVDTEFQWGAASRQVGERITGGDSTQYSFGGRNPAHNPDGMMPERMAVWHVFQQNESLRLDLKSGNFYETASDGSTNNRFHISDVAALERQAGGNVNLASRMVGEFLLGRDLAVEGTRGTQNPVTSNLTPLAELRPQGTFGAFGTPSFG